MAHFNSKASSLPVVKRKPKSNDASQAGVDFACNGPRMTVVELRCYNAA